MPSNSAPNGAYDVEKILNRLLAVTPAPSRDARHSIGATSGNVNRGNERKQPAGANPAGWACATLAP